jgi:hypothetical protein
MPSPSTPSLRELATELARRAVIAKGGAGTSVSVVRVSNPVTQAQRVQLIAARLQAKPFAIMPVRCRTTAEWLQLYADPLRTAAEQARP